MRKEKKGSESTNGGGSIAGSDVRPARSEAVRGEAAAVSMGEGGIGDKGRCCAVMDKRIAMGVAGTGDWGMAAANAAVADVRSMLMLVAAAAAEARHSLIRLLPDPTSGLPNSRSFCDFCSRKWPWCMRWRNRRLAEGKER